MFSIEKVKDVEELVEGKLYLVENLVELDQSKFLAVCPYCTSKDGIHGTFPNRFYPDDTSCDSCGEYFSECEVVIL